MSEDLIKHSALIGQECIKSAPVIVLGSGSSIPYRLPSMNELANHLIKSVKTEKLNKFSNRQWIRLKTHLENQIDLESALKKVNVSDQLRKEIVSVVWKKINYKDVKFFREHIEQNKELPLANLFKYLFDSTNKFIEVVTTNYDRIAEYSAESVGYNHYTGFSHGYKRYFTLDHASVLQKLEDRTVRIWKVHGCLDWFNDEFDQTIALTQASVSSFPKKFQPAIVTPGIAKYEETHDEPFRSIISQADKAFQSAKSFLCIGFGFNDKHISPKLKQKWISGSLLVILTRTLSENAKQMLNSTSSSKYLALEKVDNGTKLWSHKYPKGEIIENKNLWTLSEFLSLTQMGE